MKTVIEENELYAVYQHSGMTNFRGCQCFKDCTCSQDFIPLHYDYFSVKKKFNKIKTTQHDTLEEAMQRVEFLKTIQVNYSNKKAQKY